MGFRGEEFAFRSPAEAVDAMIACVASTPAAERKTDRVALAQVLGRVLAESVTLDRDSPAFDHSAMDGYALRLADFARIAAAPLEGASSPTTACTSEGTTRIPVVGESRIGSEPPAMPSRGAPNAIRIVTGAGVPSGADCIVKREDVTEHAGVDDAVGRGAGDGVDIGVAAISIASGVLAGLRAGDNIRRRGENARAGEIVLHAGSIVSAAGVGVLAGVGATTVDVTARVRVAIITTGDELVPPDQVPATFQIRNSNAPALQAILGALGWLEVTRVVHVRDDGPILDEQLRAATTDADAILLTGGVSMGHRDPVRAAVERLGARIIFHGLPQRPGKPMLGAIVQNPPGSGSPASPQIDRGVGPAARGPIPIFGLPGNPISAMVTSTRIVVPVLAAMAGSKRLTPSVSARLVTINNPDGKSLDLWWHRLAVLESDGSARLLPALGSGDIVAGGRSDGFVEIPPGARLDSKTPVTFFAWAGG